LNSICTLNCVILCWSNY